MGRDWKLLRKKFEDDQKIEKHSALDLMNEEMAETQQKDGAKMEKLESMLEEAEKKRRNMEHLEKIEDCQISVWGVISFL